MIYGLIIFFMRIVGVAVTGFALHYTHNRLHERYPSYAAYTDRVGDHLYRSALSFVRDLLLPAPGTVARPRVVLNNAAYAKLLTLLSLSIYSSIIPNDDEVRNSRIRLCKATLLRLCGLFAPNFSNQHIEPLVIEVFGLQLRRHNESFYFSINLIHFLHHSQSNGREFWEIFNSFHKEFKELGPYILGNHFFKKLILEVGDAIVSDQVLSILFPPRILELRQYLFQASFLYHRSRLNSSLCRIAEFLDQEIIDHHEITDDGWQRMSRLVLDDFFPILQAAIAALGGVLVTEGGSRAADLLAIQDMLAGVQLALDNGVRFN